MGTLGPTGSAAFLTIGLRSGPEWNGPLQNGGRYTLDVVLDRQVIGSVPFTVTVTDGDDPFDPQTIYALDGPWRTHSYFEHETDQPEGHLWYNAWIAPGETRDNTKTEVSLRRDGEEVAWGTTFVGFQYGWKRAEYVLYTPDSRPDEHGREQWNKTLFTIQDVTPGPYEMVFLDADGREFRRVALEGAAGAFPVHPRSAIDYEPRSQFLSSRALRATSLDTSLTRYWVVTE